MTINPPTDVAATETIQRRDSEGRRIAEVSLVSAQPDRTLRIPIREGIESSTGLALVNVGTGTTKMSFTLRAANGSPSAGKTIQLAPNQQIAESLNEFVYEGELNGILEVSSSGVAIAVVAFQIDSATGNLSTVPVFLTPPEAYFSPDAGISRGSSRKSSERRSPSILRSIPLPEARLPQL